MILKNQSSLSKVNYFNLIDNGNEACENRVCSCKFNKCPTLITGEREVCQCQQGKTFIYSRLAGSMNLLHNNMSFNFHVGNFYCKVNYMYLNDKKDYVYQTSVSNVFGVKAIDPIEAKLHYCRSVQNLVSQIFLST